MKKIMVYIGLVCLGTVIGVNSRQPIDQREVINDIEMMIEYMHSDIENGTISKYYGGLYIEGLEEILVKIQ